MMDSVDWAMVNINDKFRINHRIRFRINPGRRYESEDKVRDKIEIILMIV